MTRAEWRARWGAYRKRRRLGGVRFATLPPSLYAIATTTPRGHACWLLDKARDLRAMPRDIDRHASRMMTEAARWCRLENTDTPQRSRRWRIPA